jgi:hypothetical protein
LAFAPPVIVAPFGETDIERPQKAETRLLAAREIRPIAGIAQQDRASLCGLVGRRALVEFASADDIKPATPITPPKGFAMERSHAIAPSPSDRLSKGGGFLIRAAGLCYWSP